jgi:copper chaperone NosL
MTRTARVLTAIASVTLAALFIVPLWQIHLVAPQYPEGLGMQIGISDIRGVGPNDLNNINGLNHYIGMKHITPEAIPELRYMPWIVGGLILFGLIAAAVGNRKVLFAWMGTFSAVAVAGLVDFWRWEYDYGHNIDFEHAIIKIPGMNYQPPLIGVKQLLNFTAVSWPDIGAWIALAAFGLGALAVIATVRSLPTRASVAAPGRVSGLMQAFDAQA